MNKRTASVEIVTTFTGPLCWRIALLQHVLHLTMLLLGFSSITKSEHHVKDDMTWSS